MTTRTAKTKVATKKTETKNTANKNTTNKKAITEKAKTKKETTKRKTATSSPNKAPPQKKNPLEDPSLKARWTEAILRFERSSGQEADGWDDMYEALGDIFESDPPLYLAGGYKTDRAFVEDRLPGMSAETAWSYIRVARYFDPEDEQRYGVSKLDLLVRYLQACGKLPAAGTKLKAEKAKLTRADGKFALFPELSFDELRETLRGAKAQSGKATPHDSPVAKAIRQGLVAAKVRGVGVRLRAKKLDLTGIPLDKLGPIGKALSAMKLPLS